MRTTLTIDDDIAAILEQESIRKGMKFKILLNKTLRRGLELEEIKRPSQKITIQTFPMGLKPGIDPDKMNQLTDALEVEEFSKKQPFADSSI